MKTLFWLLFAGPSLVSAGGPLALFDGASLSGWTADVPEADGKPQTPPTFIVRDGMLVSLGKPGGHLITERSFSNYSLLVEYRFPEKCGSGGVLVHVSKPRLLYHLLPQSIEVQLMHGHAGDFWCIGEDITVPDSARRRPCEPGQIPGTGPADARRILKTGGDCENPPGEWNTLAIDCTGPEIKVTLNGTLVNHGTDGTASSGKIALQAEGSVVEFRRIELTPHAP